MYKRQACGRNEKDSDIKFERIRRITGYLVGTVSHDSWLWCLVLANMEDELKAAAEELRKALSNPKVLKKLYPGFISARRYNL